MNKKINPSRLFSEVKERKHFILWIESEKSYYIPVYNVIPKYGFLCVVLDYGRAFIATITDISHKYGNSYFSLETLKRRDYHGIRFNSISERRIPCLLKRVDRKSLEQSSK